MNKIAEQALEHATADIIVRLDAFADNVRLPATNLPLFVKVGGGRCVMMPTG